jgi:hypothetical protein
MNTIMVQIATVYLAIFILMVIVLYVHLIVFSMVNNVLVLQVTTKLILLVSRIKQWTVQGIQKIMAKENVYVSLILY